MVLHVHSINADMMGMYNGRYSKFGVINYFNKDMPSVEWILIQRRLCTGF